MLGRPKTRLQLHRKQKDWWLCATMLRDSPFYHDFAWLHNVLVFQLFCVTFTVCCVICIVLYWLLVIRATSWRPSEINYDDDDDDLFSSRRPLFQSEQPSPLDVTTVQKLWSRNSSRSRSRSCFIDSDSDFNSSPNCPLRVRLRFRLYSAAHYLRAFVR